MRFPPFLSLILLALSLTVFAQQTKSQPPPKLPDALVTPEVHADNTVTFRFLAPNAKDVKLDLDSAEPAAMQKDDQGVWALTTPPLAPDYYEYSVRVDGARMLDPYNSLLVPNLLTPANAVHVPGPEALWDERDVPHGEIHHHFYKSAVAEDNRDYYIYTPAGYDPTKNITYPVLYLLHGFSDDASGWIAVGHANVIFDNLIAVGKVKPMIVVMPLGYGTMEFLRRGDSAWSDAELRDRNYAKFSDMLLSEVMPRVETEYRVARDRNSRAIAGLSMGGKESLLTGLNHLDKFAWIGSFSSAGEMPEDLQQDFSSLDAKANQQIRLLWIACGTADHLIDFNRKLRAWLESKGVHHTDIETPGQHSWLVWRRNLVEFTQLIFR